MEGSYFRDISILCFWYVVEDKTPQNICFSICGAISLYWAAIQGNLKQSCCSVAIFTDGLYPLFWLVQKEYSILRYMMNYKSKQKCFSSCGAISLYQVARQGNLQ